MINEDKKVKLKEDDLMRWIETEVHYQMNAVKFLVDDYWRQFIPAQKVYRDQGQGNIGVRIRYREKSLSFSIEWFRISRITINGQSKSIAEHIRKGTGFAYPLTRMLNGEPDWEVKLVEEFEVEFIEFRKRVHALGKVRDAIKHFYQIREYI